MLKKSTFSILSFLLIVIFFTNESFAQPMILLTTSVHQFQKPVLKGKETNQVIPIEEIIQQNKNLNYIFKSGTEGYSTFRIPAIVTTNSGKIVAFAEGRRNSSSDTGDIDLVMKSSEDGGKTWSPLKTIWNDGDNVCGNAAPVVDCETGEIHLLMTWNLGEDQEKDIIDGKSKDTRNIFVTSSTDDGVNWTIPKEITSSVKKDKTWQTIKVLNSGASAYSDLTLIDKKTLGCLYEGGIFSPYEGIVFTTFEIK
ncbi:MAG: glycoside hydrolase [Bacteroidales bacterium]|nr:glycoside hydrolase [Bacteroidales bacterium]